MKEFYTSEGCFITELSNVEVGNLPGEEVVRRSRLSRCTPRFTNAAYEENEC